MVIQNITNDSLEQTMHTSHLIESSTLKPQTEKRKCLLKTKLLIRKENLIQHRREDSESRDDDV